MYGRELFEMLHFETHCKAMKMTKEPIYRQIHRERFRSGDRFVARDTVVRNFGPRPLNLET